MSLTSTADCRFGLGWYSAETDDRGEFRWMGPEATITIDPVPGTGPAFLKIIAGHPFADQPSPTLTVTPAGGPVETRVIDPWFSSYAFALEGPGPVEVMLALDRTRQVSGDPRELGIMVRRVCLVTPAEGVMLLEGWYENEGVSASVASRWMKMEATALLPAGGPDRGADFVLSCGLPREDHPPATLAVSAGDHEAGTARITPGGMRDHCFPLDTLPPRGEVRLFLDGVGTSPDDGDPRPLGMVVEGARLDPRGGETPLFLDGWHGVEDGERGRSRWSEQRAAIGLPNHGLTRHRYLLLTLASEYDDGSQELSLSLDGRPLERFPLHREWFQYSIEHGCRPEGADGRSELRLELSKAWSSTRDTADTRELGLTLMDVAFHDDPKRHSASVNQRSNIRLNHREMTEGRTVLESGPLNLGVDLYGVCNMKPPCVYCTWDLSKSEEGDLVDAEVSAATLEGYGSFYSHALNVVNCSIGEPLLHPGIEEILESCERHNLMLELATNGQAFSTRVIRALAGKRIMLNISLDAASAETYARIRNDRWNTVITRLRELHEVRRAHGNLPRVCMVFMPMKVNRHEVEAYFALCRDTGADALVLRPLNYLDIPGIRIDRGGYLFEYQNELLDRPEIETIIEECVRLSVQYKMPLYNQFDFGLREDR